MRGPERSHPTIYWSKQTRALGPRQRTTADLRDWKVITLNLPDSVKRACSFADLRHHPPAAHTPPSPLPPKLPPLLEGHRKANSISRTAWPSAGSKPARAAKYEIGLRGSECDLDYPCG